MRKSVAVLSAVCAAAWMVFGCDSSDGEPATHDKHADAVDVESPDASAPAAPDASSASPDEVVSHEADADGNYPDLRGKCNINSGYPGDEACLPAPPPSEGMQIHIGPSNYDDEEEVSKYLLHPGEETSQCWTFHTPNDEPIYYQTFVLSGRAGTHHIINTMFNDSQQLTEGQFTVCADGGIGTNNNIIDNLPGASRPYMPRGHIAPENAHIGRKIPAHAAAQADMHYFNFTDHDIIREF